MPGHGKHPISPIPFCCAMPFCRSLIDAGAPTNGPARVAVGTNANVDLVVQGVELMQVSWGTKLVDYVCLLLNSSKPTYMNNE